MKRSGAQGLTVGRFLHFMFSGQEDFDGHDLAPCPSNQFASSTEKQIMKMVELDPSELTNVTVIGKRH